MDVIVAREAGSGSLVDRVLARSPVQGLLRGLGGRKLAVLGYHGIEDASAFARQIDWLARWTKPVSLDDVIAAANGVSALPKHAVLVTFDDGHRSVLEVALPLLRERDIPAVVFVIAELLDKQKGFWVTEAKQLSRTGGRITGRESRPEQIVRVLSRLPVQEREAAMRELRATAPSSQNKEAHIQADELTLLEAGGIAVGNHSLSHSSLAACSDEELTKEIVESNRVLMDALGHHPRAFSYPFGYVDERAPRILKETGYQVGFKYDHRLTKMPPSDPLRLSRVQVKSTSSVERLKIIVSGLNPALHRSGGRYLRAAEVRIKRARDRSRSIES